MFLEDYDVKILIRVDYIYVVKDIINDDILSILFEL